MFEHATAAGIHENVNKIFRQRTDLKGKVVVDLACGDGRTTHLLRSLGAQVRPYDIMPESYKLEDEAQYADVMQALPIDSESADLVILQEVIEHLPNHLFALQEIHRILRPGGELFVTTPNRSALVSKLAYLCFESEFLRGTPASAIESVWAEKKGRKYYGHNFLIGVQQVRTLGMLAGFSSIEIHKSDISGSSVGLMAPLYPILFLTSLKASFRARKKSPGPRYAKEKKEQFLFNISPRVLTSKYLIATLSK